MKDFGRAFRFLAPTSGSWMTIACRNRKPWRSCSRRPRSSVWTPCSAGTFLMEIARASMCSRRPVALGANGVPQYPYYLAHGIIELEAISFASFFIPADLVRKAGLPMKELFLWGDDHEYSLRLARFAKLFQVGKSRMIHFKSGDAGLQIAKETKAERIPLYRYLYRNRLYITATYYGVTSTAMAKLLWRGAKDIIFSIRSGDHVALKCATIVGSYWDGVKLTMTKVKKGV